MSTPLRIAWTTLPNEDSALAIARSLVDEGLAACVQIDPGLRSVYRWEGEIKIDPEFRLSIKCSVDRIAAVRDRVFALHPYDTPEWIVMEADQVAEDYLRWATS